MRRFLAPLTLLIFAGCETDEPTTRARSEKVQTRVATTAAPEASQRMVFVQGGSYIMGSSAEYAEKQEGPEIEVRVSSFYIDPTEVINARYAEFVEEKGYVTVAERPTEWEQIKKELLEGDELTPNGDYVANFFQGDFLHANEAADGLEKFVEWYKNVRAL